MRRLIVAFCAMALASTACAAESFGQDLLMCRIDLERVPTSVILTLQAVPSADYIPCIDEPQVGWEFAHVTAESGRAQFVGDSDRFGANFLVVTLLDACDVGGAVRSTGTEFGSQLWVDLHEETTSAGVVILPVAGRHRAFSQWIAAILQTRNANGLAISPAVSPSLEPMAHRITEAHATGASVLVVDDHDVLDGTASVRYRDGSETIGLGVAELVDAIAAAAPEPSYRATWYYTFSGGCVMIDIDAEGREAAETPAMVDAAIDMYDATEIRRVAREAGYLSAG
jgi:hypothetical protein